jgi:hypothetical protein
MAGYDFQLYVTYIVNLSIKRLRENLFFSDVNDQISKMFRTVCLRTVVWQRFRESGRRGGDLWLGRYPKEGASSTWLTSCNATIAVMLFTSSTDCKRANFVAVDSSMSISCESKMRSWNTWSRVTPEGSLLEQVNKSFFYLFVTYERIISLLLVLCGCETFFL